MRRLALLQLVAIAALFLLPLPALGQFGLKVKKFDTGPAKKVLAEIDKVVKEYEEATAHVWVATETVQDIVKQYASGEFPVLTKTWEEIRKSLAEAKDEAERTAAFKLTDAYFKEMDERKKAVEAFLDDPVKSADLKSKIQAPEIEQLKKVLEELRPVPKKDAEIIARSQKLNADAGKAVVDVTAQAAKDPLKAADYKKLADQLDKGVEKLNKIPAELEKQVKAVETMLSNIDKMLSK